MPGGEVAQDAQHVLATASKVIQVCGGEVLLPETAPCQLFPRFPLDSLFPSEPSLTSQLCDAQRRLRTPTACIGQDEPSGCQCPRPVMCAGEITRTRVPGRRGASSGFILGRQRLLAFHTLVPRVLAYILQLS